VVAAGALRLPRARAELVTAPAPTLVTSTTDVPMALADTVTVDRGVWSDQAPYGLDDSVTYAEATWFVVAPGGVTGVTPGTDSSRWGPAPVAVSAAGSTTTIPNPSSSPTTPTASSSATAAGGVASFSTSVPVGPSGSWVLMAGDDFPGTALNPGLWWDCRYGSGSSGDAPFNPGSEGEYFAPSQVTVADSLLTLTCDPCTPTSVGGGSYSYVSGCVTSSPGLRFSMPGTYVEARIRVPAVAWTWPAFWTVSATGYTGEFDIFEFFGDTPGEDQPMVNYHFPASGSGQADTQTGPRSYGPAGGSDLGGFHTYGLACTATTMTPYLDGAAGTPVIGTGAPGQAVSADPVELILNLSVYAGHAIPAGTAMDIDWVRVWGTA
jgi:beta-glucanase (GH16 family)